MRTVKLYTGMGASFTPVYMEGRHDSGYTRIVAEDGMYVTDGEQIMSCTDVPDAEVGMWRDCDGIDEQNDTNERVIS